MDSINREGSRKEGILTGTGGMTAGDGRRCTENRRERRKTPAWIPSANQQSTGKKFKAPEVVAVAGFGAGSSSSEL